VRCVAALWSPTSGVVDQAAYAASLGAAVTGAGGWLALRHELLAAERHHDGFTLTLRGPGDDESRVSCGALVNSVGLGAPAVASMLGYPLDGADGVPVFRQHVNKGRYYDIVNPQKARALRHLVYPVPEHARGGLGVHVTLDIDGGAHLGPDTEWLDEGVPLDYRADDLRRADFVAAARRYLPAIEPDDLAPGQVGYRPKLQEPGGPLADFLVWHDRGYVHLGGIESPGLTASLAIGRRVALMLAGTG
jgi:L-2-hydroxyglutarate oxidase LhgO